MISMTKFKKNGGKWLGYIRMWIQWNCIGGDNVTLGSNTVLNPPMTVAKLEDAAGSLAYKLLIEDRSITAARIELLLKGALKNIDDGDYTVAVGRIDQAITELSELS